MTFRKVLLTSAAAMAAFLPDSRAALTARHSHTTTLLPNGDILITGGVTSAGAKTTSVQFYNMSANTYDTWGGGGPLDAARSSHTATLMSDGKVLIAGGFGAAGTPLSTMEICDPSTKVCAAIAATLSTAKGGHTAVLLSSGANAGSVLICGGQSAASSTTVTASCDIFDPADTTSVSAGPSMVSPRVGHSASLLPGGRVFVAGGRRWDGSGALVYVPTTEIYDPATNTWTPKDALNQGRVDHTATVMNNGLIMIAGGFNSKNIIQDIAGHNEDVWTEDDTEYWGYDWPNQDLGTHGYLDGAELFDTNGGRQVIAAADYGVAPYRAHRHSALLLPDGTWRMYGGYGNIVRTMVSESLNANSDTVFYLTKTGNTTATINSNSEVKLALDTTLARPVSGRLVDADAFLSKPKDPAKPSVTPPSMEMENVSIYLTHSTAALDGLPAGTLIPGEAPGSFDNTIQLTNPAGTAYFDEQALTSDAATYTSLTVNSSALTFSGPVAPGEDALFSGSITAKLGMLLPSIYRGIKGLAVIGSGGITDPAQNYSVTITAAGSSSVDIFTPSSCDDSECLFVATVTFNASGSVSNLSDSANLNSPLNAAGGGITLEYTLYYTADEIHTGDLEPSLAYGRGDIVIREMAFSSALGFTPRTDSWKSLGCPKVSPTLSEPVFDHTAILTPAAEELVLAGRNCEASPSVDCLRTAKTFTARSARTAFIHRYVDGEGGDTWQSAGELGTKRAYHTSTLLPDGRILTCGGSDGIAPLSSCELMDPVARTWSGTGSMLTARAKHMATLLPNGRVLATGGQTSGGVTSAAELYDPATGRWAHVASMSQGRQNHSSTLLPDGNVLVAGGATLSTYSATAELYITSAAIWMSAGDMSTPRAQHTATSLRSGNVLMTGGVNGFGAVDGTDIYSFSARTFSAGPDLNTPRYAHTANLMMDGKVLVSGGSDNMGSLTTSEAYDGASWTYAESLRLNRANHRSVLLPNGNIIVTGGEVSGGVQSPAERYNANFSTWTDQGEIGGRSHHTTVLTEDNYLINIGGWDGSSYLKTSNMAYFSYSPDIDGYSAGTRRQPEISTSTSYLDRGQRITLLSGTSNFHGLTEAAGGGSGPMSSSHGNPRVYMQKIDSSGGFMIDLSTRIYSLYGGVNTASTEDWERTMSSITVISPSAANQLPYGYYHMRAAGNAQFSEGKLVQVTIPRPTGTPRFDPNALQYTFLGTTSVQWTWDRNGITADGFAVFSATDSVLLGFAPIASSGTYIQTGLAPNTSVKIAVSGYNIGGYGPSAASNMYYTKAVAPTGLTVDYASFETVSLQWNPMGNSQDTAYELSVSQNGTFSDQWIAIPFSENHASTSAVLNTLTPDQVYYFRVRARNGTAVSRIGGFGEDTAYSSAISTKTVGNVGNLSGTPVSVSSIRWDWDPAVGSPSYEIYDITDPSSAPVLLSSSSSNGYTQTGLLSNTYHTVTVNAFDPGTGSKGPAVTASAYTLAAQPIADPVSSISTGSLTLNWQNNGNAPGTRFSVTISPNSDLSGGTVVQTEGHAAVIGGLVPNTLYYAQVTALNDEDVETDPVSLGSAYTLAQPLTNFKPVSVSMSGVTLTWNTGSNSPGTIYEVRGTTTPNRLTDSDLPGIVTTYLPFSSGHNSDTASFNGLLTSTTYYFDIAAKNSAGVITARTQAVPAAYTLAGPNGAPAGSIGGTSNPSSDVTISGMLPDNRVVALSVPAGAYPAQTAIAIAPSVTDSCRQNLGVTPLVEVAVYTENGLQPQVPVTLKINYLSDDAVKITPNISNLLMGRYNPVSGDCLPLETVIDPGPRTITAKLNHFSVFQLVYKNAAADLSAVRIYPNPYYMNRGQGFVTIDNMPASTEARIYTLSGDKIWEGKASDTGLLTWDATNSSGVLVGSGVYLAVLDSTGGKKIVKIAVER